MYVMIVFFNLSILNSKQGSTIQVELSIPYIGAKGQPQAACQGTSRSYAFTLERLCCVA